MYDILLGIHNLLRWFFLAAAVYAIFRSVNGLRRNDVFSKADNQAGTFLLIFAHTQLLIGLILWFMSPSVQMALADFGNAMHTHDLRFKMLEHPLTMIIAVALIQVGRIRSKKAYSDADKFRRSLMFYSIGLILVLSRIPWNMPMWRF
jgi:hypothetical protein